MNISYTLLVYLVWFLSTYFVLVILLTLYFHKEEVLETQQTQLPPASIVISAYNEEKDIENSIKSLLAVDYPKELLEIIIVNDGSTDHTKEVIQPYVENKQVVFIDNFKNKGKAACLNQGIAAAHGTYIACMDADSMIDPDILKKTLPYFKNPAVGAVTVSVEVHNPQNYLEKVIELEYIIGLSLLLKIFSLFNTIHVTPGPFSIYRTSVLKEIGGFDSTNITEDLEIAYRLHKAGHKIAFCMNTKVRTVIPNTLKTLLHQRKRWYSGALLTAAQHRTMFFTGKHGLFGYFVPFNLAIIFLGLVLFFYSHYLFISNIIRSLSFYALINYNFLAFFSLKNFDILSISIFGFFGVSSIIFTILLLIIGMRFSKKTFKNRLTSSLGFVFLFFLYQIFWCVSFYSVLTKRKIRW